MSVLEELRSQWSGLLGGRKIGEAHERKAHAIQAALRMLKAWTQEVAEADPESHRLMEQMESHFKNVAKSAFDDDRRT